MTLQSTEPAADDNNLVTCPMCNGEKTLTAAFMRYSPVYEGPVVREFPCYICNSMGYVSKKQFARAERGEKFRRHRVDVLNLGLREAATAWGMMPSRLSHIEQGKVETDWTPPGWSDK
jgi:hypothetical protein